MMSLVNPINQDQQSKMKELHEVVNEGCFHKAGRPVYAQVNLSAITHNIQVLKNRCKNKHIGVIAVIKSAGYGHGSVTLGNHLKKAGIERLAVATVDEGILLRHHGVGGPIHVFGNCQSYEMKPCLEYSLIPTVCHVEPIRTMGHLLRGNNEKDEPNEKIPKFSNDKCSCLPSGAVHIKVDTGMSRNGCQPSELEALVKTCDESAVPLEGIMTHLADTWDNPDFTARQMECFYSAVQPFRDRPSLHLHTSASGAVLKGYGTELDFIRPGISIYGLPPSDADEEFVSAGLQPSLSVRAQATLIKKCPPGTKVGYGCTYTCKEDEWIATIPFGYGDGYSRNLSNKGVVVRDATGEKCAVVGRVSMDAITIRLPSSPLPEESFTIISADYDTDTSACGIARKLNTISYEIMTSLSTRIPRMYTSQGQEPVIHALQPGIY